MPASQLQALLSDLTSDFQANQPKDIVQFCADWFQDKLRQERSTQTSGNFSTPRPSTATPISSTTSTGSGGQRKFPSFPAMTLPSVPANVFNAHLTQPSPFSEHLASDSPFGHGSTPSSTLAQRRATFAGPSFGNSLTEGPDAGGDTAVGASAPNSFAGAPLGEVREEEEEGFSGFPGSSNPSSNVAGSFAAFSFSGGSPSGFATPESSPFNEIPTQAFGSSPSGAQPASNTPRFPPSANSTGKAGISADELVIPAYALGRRTSVSAESLIPTAGLAMGGGADADSTPTIRGAGGVRGSAETLPPKSEAQLERIKQSISNNFLFRNLDEEQERDVLAAMREVAVDAGHVVIEQGAAGDFFYVVEDGQFDIYVKKAGAEASIEESKWGKKVHTAVPGGSFGELALMYNAPRAATVIASTSGTLWALDRISFRTILLDHTSRKRRMYETFLATVPILASLEPYERAKIADALESRTYQAGEEVIKEGEPGDDFYLIESGVAQVEKQGAGVVGELSKGDYFGELALLNRASRAATIRASGGDGVKLRVAALGEKAFTRLLGPVREIMARKAGERYGIA
ncbi:hypothetical protein QFC22_000423 [Naganishia vaughanmartiniae]|uniref:Uncharacterized protein n=1 Tax=Naganishia vaughanmartiniae TaxID=1424756 RepID=A0ACC2XRY5_9TREE|nr:hypothetical protein QFC22_000423 [Naganishia vaughanmartiniae]